MTRPTPATAAAAFRFRSVNVSSLSPVRRRNETPIRTRRRSSRDRPPPNTPSPSRPSPNGRSVASVENSLEATHRKRGPRRESQRVRRRGVWFDVANGRTGHLRWDTFDRIMRAGFWPDTISTDGNATSATAESVIDLPNVLSKFLSFGMTVDEVVARATLNAARLFPVFRDRGTLTSARRRTWRSSSYGGARSSSSTTTTTSAPAASGSSRARRCWAADGCDRGAASP